MAGRAPFGAAAAAGVLVVVLVLAALPVPAGAVDFLTVNPSSATGLSYAGQDVFLSGVNLAWIDYGSDFGNSQPASKACALQRILASVAAAGGNSLRVWLFVDGHSVPQFDGSGMVVSTDAAGTMATDLRNFLASAAQHNVLVTLCLWNGAAAWQPAMQGLFTDDTKLQSFFDHALTPLVTALRDMPALAAWEVINEPEGSVDPTTYDANPCFDTRMLQNSGAGWNGHLAQMRDFLRFINRQEKWGGGE